MSANRKVSVPQSPERLAVHLGGLGANRRVVLVRGPRRVRDLQKFIKGLRVPSELVSELAGSMIGYMNLELTTPDGLSYYAVETLGAADAGWKVVAATAEAVGYQIADVRDLQVVPSGLEDRPIPIARCTGVLHNVYASTA